MAGLIRGPLRRSATLVPLLAAAALLTAIGLTIANWEAGDSAPIIEGALAIDTLALFMSMLFYVAGLATVAAVAARRRARRGGPRRVHARCCWARSSAWCSWPGPRTW